MNKPKQHPSKPALRLIKGDAPTSELQAAPEIKPEHKSSLVNFMQSFADAVDRDVRLLLEI